MKIEIKKIASNVTLHSKKVYTCGFNHLSMNKTLLFKLLFTGLTCIILSSDVMAQDPQFSQFYANPLYLNPAFAGTARCPRGGAASPARPGTARGGRGDQWA